MENKNILKATETKTGRKGEKILNRKEYGEKYGLKGADLKRAHYAYLRVASNRIGEIIAEKGVVLTGYSENPSTGGISLTGMTGAAYAAKKPANARGKKVLSFEAEKAKIEALGIALTEEQENALREKIGGELSAM